MLERRRALGGFLPERRTKSKALTLPGDDTYKALKKGSGNQEVATTMATVRTFKELLRDTEKTGSATASSRSFPTRPARSAWTRGSRA